MTHGWLNVLRFRPIIIVSGIPGLLEFIVLVVSTDFPYYSAAGVGGVASTSTSK